MLGRLVVATDGLFNYGRPETIAECARKTPVDRVADALGELVTLRSGDRHAEG